MGGWFELDLAIGDFGGDSGARVPVIGILLGNAMSRKLF